MRKATKLYVLLGVFLGICAAAFAVSRYQKKQEEIRTSGEVILDLPADRVTALSWTNESGAFSFTWEDTWIYDGDPAFPVDEEKMDALLAPLAGFSAAFTIENVEDAALYGLDEPVCSIRVTADGTVHTIELGDFSKMDEQRYVSLGGGTVYLAAHDLLEEYAAVAEDLIRHDTVPDFDTVEQIVFTGAENYTVLRDENGKSICEDDIFFADGLPLDTDNVETWLSAIRSLDLSDAVTYDLTDDERAAFGLDDPVLTIRLTYAAEEEAASEELLLTVSSNTAEQEAYDKAAANGDELPDVTHYVRLGQSQLVYPISQSVYNRLTAVSYDTLRHQKLFTAELYTASEIEVTLDGEEHVFTRTLSQDGDEAETVWTQNGEEADLSELSSALRALSASTFSVDAAPGQEEISLTVRLDSEDFPRFTLTLYRYDGSSCIAAVNGEITALVSRSRTVDLIEAVRALTLGS